MSKQIWKYFTLGVTRDCLKRNHEYLLSFSGGNAGISSHPGQGGLYTSGGPGSNNSHQVRHEESIGNLQHISEREPDDWEEDPSLHPTTETLFMEKSKQSIQSK